MYEPFWGLTTKPFEHCADPAFYYSSETHQGAMLKLRYAVESRRHAALLAGGAGLGKTLLIDMLKRQFQAEISPMVSIVYPQMPAAQLLQYIAEELHYATANEDAANGDAVADTEAAPSIVGSIRRITQILRRNAQEGRHAVIVVDEGQRLPENGALETLRLLLNLEDNGAPLFTLLLLGQPTLLPALDRMPELDERLGVKCLLRPFSFDETSQYIGHRLQAAGAQRQIFAPPAIEAIHYLTQGSPRRINRLCDLALLVGFAEERDTLGCEQVESVADELMAVVPD